MTNSLQIINIKKVGKQSELFFPFLQDRLYEIDKSWKNNVVLFGVPVDADSSASVEEDPVVTEEKVQS